MNHAMEPRMSTASDPAIRKLDEIFDSRPFLAPPAADQRLSPGAVFHKYHILRELGRGGMGRVYEAKDLELGRRVALKVLMSNPDADLEDAAMEEARFLREARMTARLSKHPHIVGAFETGVAEGRRFIAMEFVDGVAMDAWRRIQAPPLRQQVAILGQVALAVHHAHLNGIIHRDLKPQNVIVDSIHQPHVTDFGLGKILWPKGSVSLTDSGRAVGTPSYMSPEQACGLKGIDRRTDVYSLGVMLYEILAGRLPFRGESAIGILMQAVNEPPPLPSSVAPEAVRAEVDPVIEGICLKAMSKEATDRYPTARAFAEDIAAWIRGEAVRPAPACDRSRRGAMTCEFEGGANRLSIEQVDGHAEARVRMIHAPGSARWIPGLRWQASRSGDRVRLEFVSSAAGPGRLFLILTRGPSQGIVKLSLNGTALARDLNLYDKSPCSGTEMRFEGLFRRGLNELTVEFVGKDPRSAAGSHGFGLASLRAVPGRAEPAVARTA